MAKKNEVDVPARALDVIVKLPDSELSDAEKLIKQALSKERERQDTDDSSHISRPQQIKVAHSVQMFQLPNGQGSSEIDVVILGSLIMRAYYVSKDMNSPVYCESLGGKTGRPQERAHELRPDLDLDVAWFCATCPLDANTFVEGRGKACKEMRKLLVFHPSSVKPLTLSIPPTSIGRFDRYFDKVDSENKVLSSVITKIKLTLKEAKNPYSSFNFEMGPQIPPDQFLAGMKLRDLYQESIRSVDASDYYGDAFANEDRTPVNTEDEKLPF